MNDDNDNDNQLKYKMNFNFIIPKEYWSKFQSIFSYIKKKYQIKFSRKSQIDSLLKKYKGKFFKTIHEIMNKNLNISVKRLPQFFITNITIEYNKKYLDKNIIQIYQEFNNLPDYKTLIEKNIIKSNKEQLFKEFCSYSLINLYDIYCESKRFKKVIKEIKKKEGKRIGFLYEFVSFNCSAYYKYSKPHLLKSKRLNNQNDLSENDSQNNNKDELDLDDSSIKEKNII
jgi:hypothetical protein